MSGKEHEELVWRPCSEDSYFACQCCKHAILFVYSHSFISFFPGESLVRVKLIVYLQVSLFVAALKYRGFASKKLVR